MFLFSFLSERNRLFKDKWAVPDNLSLSSDVKFSCARIFQVKMGGYFYMHFQLDTCREVNKWNLYFCALHEPRKL